MKRWSALALAGTVLVLATLTSAHGDEHDSVAPMAGMGKEPGKTVIAPTDPSLNTYFRHPEHVQTILWHIILATLAWAFVLPIAVVLNVAKSPHAIPAQITFHTLNTASLLAAALYTSKTPDLYPHNLHARIGLIASLAAAAWMLLSLVALFARRNNKRRASGQHQHSSPVTAAALMAQYRRVGSAEGERRWSGDSGQGTERNSASLCGASRSPSLQSEVGVGADKEFAPEDDDVDVDDGNDDESEGERRGFLRRVPVVDRVLSNSVRKVVGMRRAMFGITVATVVLDRVVLLLGFVGITTGAVVYSGIFNGASVFNGLAHFIKGGIFFWYGLLTFGRWMGCCADWGWGWNRKPGPELVGKWAARVPTAEMLESFVICMYGVTNVGLEHLASTDGEWAPTDLEHVSITLMFFGGGLLGMMVESKTMRNLMMSTIQLAGEDRTPTLRSPDFEEPEQWRISLNPMPALMICLLGIMMGSHHQDSMVSTMLHTQWGNMFMGFALARLATYAILYIRGPVGYLPQRPPTEVITSFCLMAGGLLFMLSNKDTVAALEYNELDAMFVFNVTMGFTAFIMAWAALCMAVKGWAQRREARRVAAPMA